MLATPVPSGSTLRLNCLIEGEHVIFPVIVRIYKQVIDLKTAIQNERKDSLLKDVDPNTLALGMVSVATRSDIPLLPHPTG